jgi:hypothetical protein
MISKAKAADARSIAAGKQASGPAISVFLIGAGYGETVPETLRRDLDPSTPERGCRVPMRRPYLCDVRASG